MDSTGAQLGPFRLVAPIAKGGMGAVWRAVHVDQRVPVALKVMNVDARVRPDFVDRFREEVRAVAALDHPNIAMILDHGEVGPGVPGLGPGDLWFAIELCEGGTLTRWPTGFADLKRGWLHLLDALAHAHARGVLHRDLKPGNVLLAGAQEHPILKLVDFGVAFARYGPDRTGPIDELIVGTPQYMAPEQLRGDFRDYGPWTDLYALGCVAWGQLTGRTPFAGRNATDTLIGHLTRPLPKFEPRGAVPPELEEWLRGLLEKDFTRRFQRAADAAQALQAVGDAVAVVAAALPIDGATEVWERPTPTPLPKPVGDRDRPRAARMPATWRRADPPPPPLPLFGAGLRLFGLRRVPFVGREAERDTLWRLLGEVTRTGRARCVVVRGAAGTGKSALVQWLCERAHETGAASWNRATFTPGLSQGEPLHRMGNAWLNTKGLDRPQVHERVVAYLGKFGAVEPYEADVLTELLHPAVPEDLGPGERGVRLTRVREYYAGTRNGMRREATERPLVVWLDDVQWGIHGIGLATHILRTQDEAPFPILLILTVRDEALARGSIEEDRLERLLELAAASQVVVGPLPRATQAELVSRMLWLAPELGAQVVDRTGGNPLFAVQLVTSLVQGGKLRLGDRGLALPPGGRLELPRELATVWRDHLRTVLDEFPAHTAGYLEIAAVLGTPVDRREWRRACDDPDEVFGDRFPGDEALRRMLVDRLIEERLAIPTAQGWAFVHGMLEEALRAEAAANGRLAAHHDAAARVLSRKAHEPPVLERLGMHLLAAGRTADAVEPLLRGCEVSWVTVGAACALAVLAKAREAAADLPASDPRWGRLHVLAGALHLELEEPDAARAAATAALAGAATHGWPTRRAREVLAALALLAGDMVTAESEWTELQIDPATRPWGDKGLGQLRRRQKRPADAARHYAAAAFGFDALGEDAEAARCEALRGRVLVQCGERTEARAALEHARAVFEARGAAGGLAECLETLARLDREERHADRAEARLREAIALREAVGATVHAHLGRLRLGRWLAADDRRAELGPLIDRATRVGGIELGAREVVREAGRWAAAGLRGDLDAWDAAFDAVAAAMPSIATGQHVLAAETTAWLGWIAATLLPPSEEDRRELARSGVSTVFELLGRDDVVAELAGG